MKTDRLWAYTLPLILTLSAFGFFLRWRFRLEVESAVETRPVSAALPSADNIPSESPPVRMPMYWGSTNAARLMGNVGDEVFELPLQHTAVQATIVGVMSSVRVRHVFVNERTEPIDAVFAFPLPEHAAVHAMTMSLGGRRVVAQIRRRDEARNLYVQARERGMTVSLLEQERPNLFTQSVANIRPGDRIEVDTEYVEELVPRDGRYHFVFPMVASPRAQNGGAQGVPSQAPLVPPNTRLGREISLTVNLHAGMPIEGLRSTTHEVEVNPTSEVEQEVVLQHGDRIPNRDFVLEYSLQGERPRTAILTQRDDRGGHLLFMLQPAREMTEAALAPREYIFVVDTSGSMNGIPIARAKALLRRCLSTLRPRDTYQVVRFAGTADRLRRRPIPAGQVNLQGVYNFLDGSKFGGTNFLNALDETLDTPPDPQRSRIVVFLSDGFIDNEDEVLRRVHAHLGEANLFVVGIGSAVNRHLLDGMARVGHGEAFVLLNSDNTTETADRLFRTLARPSLTHITLTWVGVNVADTNPTPIPDLFADRPIVVAGRFQGSGTGSVRLDGFLGGEPYSETFPVTLPAAPTEHGTALAYLWARRANGSDMDRYALGALAERGRMEQRVIERSLAYSLMSDFTSFVAVDERVRGAPSIETVPVPTPVPQGVNPAVQFSNDQVAPGDPEIIVRAPATTRRVTAFLPDGQTLSLRRDLDRGGWVGGFIVPDTDADGIYTVRVVITLDDGSELVRAARYQSDGTAPTLDVRWDDDTAVIAGERFTVRVRASNVRNDEAATDDTRAAVQDVGDVTFDARTHRDLADVTARLDGRAPAAVSTTPDGDFLVTLDSPTAPGHYTFTVVAHDAAGNVARSVHRVRVVAASSGL